MVWPDDYPDQAHADEASDASVVSTVHCKRVDYKNTDEARDLVRLLNAYSEDPMANSASLPESVKSTLVESLALVPGAFSIIASFSTEGNRKQPVGLANCFMGFSTFSSKPLVNIHDLVVLPEYRGNGIGKALLDAVEIIAIERECCKIVLEVRTDNPAEHLYRRQGFTDGDHPYIFLSKALTKNSG